MNEHKNSLISSPWAEKAVIGAKDTWALHQNFKKKDHPREIRLSGKKVHWTDTAEGHLDAIYAFIALDSTEYARRMVDRITRRSQQITDFPNMISIGFAK